MMNNTRVAVVSKKSDKDITKLYWGISSYRNSLLRVHQDKISYDTIRIDLFKHQRE